MLTPDKVDDAIIGTADFSLDNLPKAFDRLPNYKFTREDHSIMANMLELKKQRKLKQKEKTTTYISPALPPLAKQDDSERSIVKHQLIIEQYVTSVDADNLVYDKRENNTTIDASKFDSEDFAVLDLINKVIAGMDKSRDSAQKKSTNRIIKEREIA